PDERVLQPVAQRAVAGLAVDVGRNAGLDAAGKPAEDVDVRPGDVEVVGPRRTLQLIQVLQVRDTADRYLRSGGRRRLLSPERPSERSEQQRRADRPTLGNAHE